MAPFTKFVPITPSVKLTSPAKADAGVSAVMVATGLLIVTVPPVKIRCSISMPIGSAISSCTGELAKPIGVVVPNDAGVTLKVTSRICLTPAVNFCPG